MMKDEHRVKQVEISENQTFPPDPVIEYYKARIDREQLKENLKLTPEQRLQKFLDRVREEQHLREMEHIIMEQDSV